MLKEVLNRASALPTSRKHPYSQRYKGTCSVHHILFRRRLNHFPSYLVIYIVPTILPYTTHLINVGKAIRIQPHLFDEADNYLQMAETIDRPRKILFFTNSDYGQANVVLATIHSLYHMAPSVEIHIASLHPLESSVREAATRAVKIGARPGAKVSSAQTPNNDRIFFHAMEGLSQYEAGARPEVGVPEAYDLTPGFINTSKNILIIPGIMQPVSIFIVAEFYHTEEEWVPR